MRNEAPCPHPTAMAGGGVVGVEEQKQLSVFSGTQKTENKKASAGSRGNWVGVLASPLICSRDKGKDKGKALDLPGPRGGSWAKCTPKRALF